MADIEMLIMMVIVVERGFVLIQPGHGFGKVTLGDVCRGIFCRGRFVLHGGIFVGFLFIAGEGDVGTCFEELFPELHIIFY